MQASATVNLTALIDHRRVRNLWLGIIIAGLILFVGLLFVSYFVLNAPSITHDAMRYKRAGSALGFSELAGLVLSAIALFRYVNLKDGYRKQIFDQLVSENGWSLIKKYDISKVASILLGAGTAYEEGYACSGKYRGHAFSCLVFQYDAHDSKTRRFVCLNFKLPKAYPMLVIDNKLNDHGYRRHDSDLPDRVPNEVVIRLEGNFNNYYRVSTTKGRERESVEVMSPDFMSKLVDIAKNKVDIEISDTDLFLIYDADFYTEQNTTALFGTADTVLEYISKLSKTWEAGSQGEEQAIAQSADTTRHKLIYRSDYLSVLGSLLILTFVIMLMVSNIHQ